MSDSQLQNENEIEVINPYVSRKALADGKIGIYTVTDPARENIDAWINTMLRYIEAAPPNHRFYTLYDVAYPKMAFTPYIRRRFEEMSRRSGQTTGCTAVVIQRTILAAIARPFIEREMTRRHPTQRIRVFFTIQEGLAWLETELATEAATV